MSQEIAEIFPEIHEIESEQVRDVVIDSWEIVREESPTVSITDILWAPHFSDDVGEQNFVEHLRSVTALSIEITDNMLSGGTST